MTVGFREGVTFDTARPNWDATGARPLSWSAWYPATEDAAAAVPEEPSWFRRGSVAKDAALRPSDKVHPLVLLSHGSGATTIALDWLAHRLARIGYVALAVNHHGHTGTEPYRAEGFLCLWERARDLSALLDDTSWRDALGGAIDQRADVAGFSAGAYTAMMLMGARVAYSQFEPDNPVKSPIRGPREFPDLADELPKLQGSLAFRQSWARRRDNYADARVRKAVVIAPGRSVLGFSVKSLKAVGNPTHIVGGDADTVAPAVDCCQWLHGNVSSSTLEILTGGVGHYTFLPEGAEPGKLAAPELFRDPPRIERKAVHDRVAGSAALFFGAGLGDGEHA